VSARRPKQRRRAIARHGAYVRGLFARQRRAYAGAFVLRTLPDDYVIYTPNPSREHRTMGARQR
jgi:hypothetical protein